MLSRNSQSALTRLCALSQWKVVVSGEGAESAVLVADGCPAPNPSNRRGSRCISMRQAANHSGGRRLRKTEFPLVAHLTIRWSLTEVGDDSDGKRWLLANADHAFLVTLREARRS
jgi:hypothetical protein